VIQADCNLVDARFVPSMWWKLIWFLKTELQNRFTGLVSFSKSLEGEFSANRDKVFTSIKMQTTALLTVAFRETKMQYSTGIVPYCLCL